MQDPLANRLLGRSVMENVDPSTARLLRNSSGANANRASSLKEAAQEFEALFLSHMLSVMRESIEESGLTDKGPGQDIYTQLFDEEVARGLAKRGALGIADLLMRNLSDPAASGDTVAKGAATPEPPASPQRSAGSAEEIGVPGFHMPLHAQLSSGYGLRRDPFTHEMKFHRGVDIAAPQGSRVHAAGAGKVVFSGYEKGYGNTVVVQHPDGFESRYAHLGELMVKEGDEIQTSQVVGTVGNTGRSTGPHLHFEISRNGNQLDPRAMLAE